MLIHCLSVLSKRRFCRRKNFPIMLKTLLTLFTLSLTTALSAQVIDDDILDSLVSDVQQGKPVENVVIDKPAEPVQHRILVFGDEQLQGIGPWLFNHAWATGFPCFTSIWQESTIKRWAYSADLQYLIRKVKPTFIIVCLGTHDQGEADLSTREAAVKAIMRDIGDIPFAWIGPLAVKSKKDDRTIADLIQQLVGADRFYDSYNLRLAREDELHPTKEGCQRWVEGFVAWLDGGEAAHPIHFVTPTTSVPFKNCETHKPSYQGKRR